MLSARQKNVSRGGGHCKDRIVKKDSNLSIANFGEDYSLLGGSKLGNLLSSYGLDEEISHSARTKVRNNRYKANEDFECSPRPI